MQTNGFPWRRIQRPVMQSTALPSASSTSLPAALRTQPRKAVRGLVGFAVSEAEPKPISNAVRPASTA